ncbi:MAG: class I SAM-dependent methyltransferase [Pirellulales bacterium]|nr:class I SAM-dependent methyltransferase [Pirellulales bacterium]
MTEAVGDDGVVLLSFGDPATAWDAEAAREFKQASLWRRAWHSARRWHGAAVDLAGAADRALDWLRKFATPRGLAQSYAPGLGDPVVCPGTTARALATLSTFGEQKLARALAESLVGLQRPDGALPDATGQVVSLVNTGWLVEAALAAGDWFPCQESWQRAAAFLAARVDLRGRLLLPKRQGGAIDSWAHPTIHLAWAPALLAAAERAGEPRWRVAGERLVSRLLRTHDVTAWQMPTHLGLWLVLALVQMRMHTLAKTAMLPLVAAMGRDGSLRARRDVRWTSAPGLALAAQVWARLGQVARADAALAALVTHQLPGGALPGSWGWQANYFPGRAVTGAALALLDAVHARVEAEFAAAAEAIPSKIDPRDGRAAAVLAWSAQLAPTARVADLGCGRGRYLALLREARPRMAVAAMDLSPELLNSVQGATERRVGSLLRAPAHDGEFDAVLAVESLEHALLPERAVAEMCRIVRPGGSVLVIDKDAACWRASEHASWERWFVPGELSQWLARYCDDVTARPLEHGPRGEGRGLFWAWTGRKRAAADVGIDPSTDRGAPRRRAA